MTAIARIEPKKARMVPTELPKPNISTLKITGAAIIFAFFFVLGGWSVAFPISSAAIAPGVVTPEGSRRTVQHLEGGIIETIHVREGDLVQVGDLLITLDRTQTEASYDIVKGQFLTLSEIAARLAKEREIATTTSSFGDYIETSGMPKITFPDTVLADIPEAERADHILAQQNLLESRLSVLVSKEEITQKEIAQLQRKIEGMEIEIDSMEQELAFVSEQITTQRYLTDQGLAPRSQLLNLQREQVRLLGEIGERKSQIAEANLQISKTERAFIEEKERYLNQVNEELSSTNTLLADMETKLEASRDTLARTDVKAAVAGHVLNLRFTAERGVVRPGEAIMDIIPEGAELLIDAQVSPSDIDNIAVGQTARVRFPAFGRQSQRLVDGEVVFVAADRQTDETTGTPYFLARVRIGADEMEKIGPDLALRAGLSADVFIITGERTAFAYLTDPFVNSLQRSFKEN